MEGTRGRRLSAHDRREQLLDTAVHLAAGRDLGAVTVQDIAAHAGISEGLLYHYFPTKQALVEAAVARAATSMITALDAVADGPPMALLGNGLAAYLDHVQADPAGWRALLQARTGELGALASAVEEHTRRLVLAAMGVEQPSRLLRMALDGWAALEREVCLSWLDHPEVPRAALEALLEGSFFATLQAVAAHDEITAAALARVLA